MNLNIMRPQFGGEPGTLIYLGTGLEFARVMGTNNYENAKSIVQACNMHKELVNTLKQISEGQEMTGEFTHIETVLRYQEIARSVLVKLESHS